ncbi:MAG: Protein of uncharacterized function [Chlamydiales bacterium]|nr:Protein of uncharacterized function [Chlamydiales bacterium]
MKIIRNASKMYATLVFFLIIEPIPEILRRALPFFLHLLYAQRQFLPLFPMHAMPSLFLLFFLALPAQSFSLSGALSRESSPPLEFHQIFESGDLTALIPHASPDCLVILELDNVLIQAKTQLGSLPFFDYLVEKDREKGCSLAESRLKNAPFWTHLQSAVQAKAIDKKGPFTLKKLQEMKVPLFSVTSRPSGALIPTLRQLNVAGFDLDKGPLQGLPLANLVMEEGVIFAEDSDGDQAEAIHRLLAHIDRQQFSCILFVDTQLKNIQRVAAAVKERGFSFLGMRYLKKDAQRLEFNPLIAKKQLEYFQKIVPDALAETIRHFSEAAELLKNWQDPLGTGRQDRSLFTLKKKKPSASFSKIDRIDQIASQLNQRTLVILNINTLMRNGSFLGSSLWAEELIAQHPSHGLCKEEAINRLVPLWQQIQLMSEGIPLEGGHQAALLIRRQQKQSIPLIGFTERNIEMAYPTLAQLKSIDIDFKESVSSGFDFTLKTPHPAKFIGGVLFNGMQNSLEESLLSFLKTNPLFFDRILQVDGNPLNLSAGEKAAKALKKEFVGFHYQSSLQKAPHPDAIKIQQLLFNTLLPDGVAKKLAHLPIP